MAKYQPNDTSIVDYLQSQILAGALAPGVMLASENELSKQYGASRQAVRRALAGLEESGLLVKRSGSGLFVSAESLPPARRAKGIKPREVSIITPFMDSYIFPNQIAGIESVLLANNCMVHLGMTYNKLNNEAKLLKALLGQRPDGVIAEPTASALPSVNGHLYQALCSEGIPVLFINTHVPALPIPFISLDDRQGAYLATRHLIDLGHRDIAIISKLDTYTGHLRYAGYADALASAQIPLDESKCVWLATGSIDDWFSVLLCDYLLQRVGDCTAVFCYNDQIASALIEVFRQRSIRVPEDISVVGYDDSDYSHQGVPPCTTIRHPSHALGAAAADRMLQMMEQAGPVDNYLFDPVLVKRESTAPRALKRGACPAL